MSSISKWNWFLISDKDVYFYQEIDDVYTVDDFFAVLFCPLFLTESYLNNIILFYIDCRFRQTGRGF